MCFCCCMWFLGSKRLAVVYVFWAHQWCCLQDCGSYFSHSAAHDLIVVHCATLLASSPRCAVQLLLQLDSLQSPVLRLLLTLLSTAVTITATITAIAAAVAATAGCAPLCSIIPWCYARWCSCVLSTRLLPWRWPSVSPIQAWLSED
jgi:hypothetical protein